MPQPAQIIGCYSESGGVGKTTTAISIAMSSARAGIPTTLIDLDPRSAVTKWLSVTPKNGNLDVGSILADIDPRGWAADMIVPTTWHENLTVLPSSRRLGLREGEEDAAGISRLSVSLDGLPARVVVIDFPNRPGGFLVLNGLEACTDVIYPALLNEDGLDGVDGATTTVQRYLRSRPADRPLREVGILPIAFHQGAVQPRHSRNTLTTLIDDYGDLVFTPPVPNRIIVSESKSGRVYYGDYAAGKATEAAYDHFVRTHVIHELKGQAA